MLFVKARGAARENRHTVAQMPLGPTDDRPLGVVYTPPAVATAMARVALEPLIQNKSSRQLLELRVCDPAIGEGVFLLAAIDILASALAASWRAEGQTTSMASARELVANSCIAGVDIDARAVTTAREKTGASRLALQIGDALTLDWREAFPETMARGGFDAVLGNPPYIRQEWLGSVRKGALRAFACYDGVADLYVYFVELAHRLLRPRGRYCLITPNKWLTAAYARPLRGFLASHGTVEGLVDLSRMPLFADADAFPCIVWGTGAASTTPLRAAKLAADAPLPAKLAGLGAIHDRERLGLEPWHVDAPDDRALLDRLAARWPTLAQVIEGKPSRGIVTGCNDAFVIDRATRDAILAADPGASALLRRFVKGRDVRRWTTEPVDRYILLVDRGTDPDAYPSVIAHLERFRSVLEPRPRDWAGAWRGRKPGPYRWYELQDPVGKLAASREPRLFYQDIQTGPSCSLDRDGLVPDTTVWILPTSDRFVLAILNSSFYGWYSRRRFPPALNGAVRPKLEYMRGLPIAQPPSELRGAIESLVDERLELEPRSRARDAGASQRARDLDAALDASILDAYELEPAERAMIERG